ncbi:MAG: acyclic terpene utilization AtuA family protein, partial [Acidobacteria bacterium]|nr:acyclic terpene utilization AtuA family protein [Acidobacteriota bacterium]
IRLDQEGPDRVRVSGIKGKPRTPFLKVSASYLEGFKASGQLTVSGPRAVEKAELTAAMIWQRLERAGVAFEPDQKTVELLGVNACLPGITAAPDEPPELVLRLGVRDHDRDKVARFGKEIAPVITSGPPGVTGFAGGRPKPQEVVAYWPALLARAEVEDRVRVSVEEA